MVIAINTIELEGFIFDEEIVNRYLTIARQTTNHQFIIIIHEKKQIQGKSDNINFLPIKISNGHSYIKWLQYQKIIADSIRNKSVDVFITPYLFSKLFLKVQQIISIPHLGFITYPKLLSKAAITFYKRFIEQSIKRGNKFITSSTSWKSTLTDRYKKDAQSIFVLQPNIFKLDPLPLKSTYQITEQGLFFLVIDNHLNSGSILFLLKSFSSFKKRLKSGMKIFFIVEERIFLQLQDIIKTYKYKEDVILKLDNSKEEFFKYAETAYAIITNNLFEGFENTLSHLIALNALIISVDSAYNHTKEIANDLALYYKENDVDSLSKNMIEAYKNENDRTNRIHQQSFQMRQFVKGQEKAIDDLIQFIVSCN